MSERAWWLMLAASLVAPSALAADAAHALTTLRVIDAKVVAPAQYGKAPGVAAHGGTPVEIALAIAGKFEVRSSRSSRSTRAANHPPHRV